MTPGSKAPASSNAASWLTIAVMAGCLALLEWVKPVPITLRSAVPLTIACTTLWAVAHYYRTARPNEEFSVMCVSLSQVLLFSCLGVTLSYLAARTNYPLWDSTLASWDKAIGFDWMAVMRLVDRSPLAVTGLSIAYASLIPQIVVVVCALGFQRRLFQLRTVMLSAMLCGCICIFISAFMPAVAYGVYLGVKPGDFDHVFPHAGFIKMPDFESLRSGSIPELDFVKMQGIITFPSYHAGLSAVTFYGFWAARWNVLRIPGMALAVLTILSTPIDGGHYLVDVIAGVAIAALCVVAAMRLVCWSPRWPLITAWPFRRSREAFVR